MDAQVLTALSRAIRAHEELRFDYVPGPSTPADDVRRVQLHHLVTWRHRRYLVAWDLHREDRRTFRVDRIRPRTPTGPRFAPRGLPGGTVSTFLTSRFRDNDGATTGWPCEGEVILRLPAADAAPFAQDGIVEGLGSRHRRLVLGSWSWTGLAAAVNRSDTYIEVVGPPRPATAFGNLATRYAHAAIGLIEAASAGQRAGRGSLAFRRYSWVASVQ
ncbi:helix-turn-helix transcriptional regulator [Streptomyces cinereoruber]|uniref:helix-turn-helix transcriptional regulator n=1 Tax=Streptomyces cinereoruber TaxID=67260 RepID=UPI00364544C4